MESSLVELLFNVDGWQALAIATKVAIYVTCFCASGGVFFLAIFGAHLSEREKAPFHRVFSTVACVGMLLSLLHIAVMNGMMGDDWSGVFDIGMTRMVLATSVGPAIALRLAGLGLIALYCRKGMTGGFFAILLAAAAAIVISFGVVGHASELSIEAGPIPLLLICLHLFAVAFWLGALWPLHRLTSHGDLALVGWMTQRFGKVAVIAVGVLIAAGAALLWLLLETPAALWQTAYGQLMMGKLACVALLLCLAAANKFRFTRRLVDGDWSAMVGLRRSIAAEMLIAGLILLISASITTLAGPPVLH
jgi:putative copper resistance protein D